MYTDYEILGLKPGASPQEIKRAYFKLIRKHSPESDPEQFQKIREAYEHLQNAQNAPEGPSFPPPSEPFAEKMLKQIELHRKTGNNILFRDTCEEAWHFFPDDIQFLYLLTIAQRKCGNTGKAVKNAELLASKEPENKWFQRELAISYMERGFTQKAFFACEKAYELGCRDLDFILMYATECSDYSKHDRGMEILLELIEQDKKWSKDEIPELMEIYFSLLTMNTHASDNSFPKIITSLCQVLEQYRLYTADYKMELATILSITGSFSGNEGNIYQKIEYAFSLLRRECRTEEEKNYIDGTLLEYNFQRLMRDSRIGDTLKYAYDAFYDINDWEPAIQKFAQLDTKLCMIEERTEILTQADIIKKDYPDFYQQLQDFLQKLESGQKLSHLKDTLLKEYQRLEPSMDGGHYYDKYPAEKEKAKGTVIFDGMADTPYVRSTKKVNRNAPCPCGSGKKYKHCCMNK